MARPLALGERFGGKPAGNNHNKFLALNDSGLTCRACRRSKVKCDRGNPCGRCKRLGVTCEEQVRKVDGGNGRGGRLSSPPRDATSSRPGKRAAARRRRQWSTGDVSDDDDSDGSVDSTPRKRTAVEGRRGKAMGEHTHGRTSPTSRLTDSPTPDVIYVGDASAAETMLLVFHELDAEGSLDVTRSFNVMRSWGLLATNNSWPWLNELVSNMSQSVGLSAERLFNPPEKQTPGTADVSPGMKELLAGPVACCVVVMAGGTTSIVCNTYWSERYLPEEVMNTALAEKPQLPYDVLAKFVAADDRDDLFRGLGRLLFATEGEKGQESLIAKCIESDGTLQLSLVTFRVDLHPDTEYCGLAMSIQPMPSDSKYLQLSAADMLMQPYVDVFASSMSCDIGDGSSNGGLVKLTESVWTVPELQRMGVCIEEDEVLLCTSSEKLGEHVQDPLALLPGSPCHIGPGFFTPSTSLPNPEDARTPHPMVRGSLTLTDTDAHAHGRDGHAAMGVTEGFRRA